MEYTVKHLLECITLDNRPFLFCGREVQMYRIEEVGLCSDRVNIFYDNGKGMVGAMTYLIPENEQYAFHYSDAKVVIRGSKGDNPLTFVVFSNGQVFEYDRSERELSGVFPYFCGVNYLCETVKNLNGTRPWWPLTQLRDVFDREIERSMVHLRNKKSRPKEPPLRKYLAALEGIAPYDG